MSAPKIVAEFITDSRGAPQYVEGPSRKHYRIRLSLRDAPPDVSRVTYKLDESYRQPLREVPIGVPHFQEEITSFGDYTVTAMLRRRAGTELVTNSLTAALHETYRSNLTPSVREAIDRLQSG
jgi:hypothetical protein